MSLLKSKRDVVLRDGKMCGGLKRRQQDLLDHTGINWLLLFATPASVMLMVASAVSHDAFTRALAAPIFFLGAAVIALLSLAKNRLREYPPGVIVTHGMSSSCKEVVLDHTRINLLLLFATRASVFLVVASACVLAVHPRTHDTFSLAVAAFIFFLGAAVIAFLSLAKNRLPEYPPAVIVTHGMSSSCKGVVLDFVERQTISLLGISGMRGVGKTTLLRFVRHSYAHHGSSPYHNRVFFVGAAGTGRTAVARLQYALAVNIGLGPPPRISDAAKIISTSLKGRPFLLLLDDVRERLDLAAVGLPMPLGHRQKVIFTTRNQAICSEMSECASSNSIHMECLGEDDAWNLFRDKVGQEIIDAHPHIKHLANKMAAECRGLPSTLCALGRAMSTKTDVKEWRYAYDALKRKRPPPVNEIQEMDDQD